MLHIGGQFAQEMQSYHQKGFDPIVFVEGDPKNYIVMEKNIEEYNTKHGTNVIPVLALVTDKDNEVYDFNRHTCAGSASSIFKVNPDKWKAKWTSREDTVVKLESRTVQSILDELGFDNGTFKNVVLDVQGAELLALKGFGTYLKSVETLLVETSRQEFYKGGVLFDALNEYLTKQGFKVQDRKIPDHGNILYKRIK